MLEGNVDKCNGPIAQGDHITAAIAATAVILLQIVMVSLGTHLVKNHESQFKKSMSPKLKILGPLCNQTFHLKTDSKTLRCSLLKFK